MFEFAFPPNFIGNRKIKFTWNRAVYRVNCTLLYSANLPSCGQTCLTPMSSLFIEFSPFKSF